jgi:hypothetical protein
MLEEVEPLRACLKGFTALRWPPKSPNTGGLESMGEFVAA